MIGLVQLLFGRRRKKSLEVYPPVNSLFLKGYWEMLQEYTKKRVGADVCIWFTFGSHNWKQAGSIACSKWGGQCAVYDAEWLESLPQKQWGVVFSLWSRGGTCWILCSVQTVLTVVQVPPVWGMSRLPRGRRGKLSSHCWVQRKLQVEVPFPLAVILCLGVLVRLRTYQLLQHSSLLSSLLLFSPALTFFFLVPTRLEQHVHFMWQSFLKAMV